MLLSLCVWTTLVVGVDMVTHDNVNAWSFDVQVWPNIVFVSLPLQRYVLQTVRSIKFSKYIQNFKIKE